MKKLNLVILCVVLIFVLAATASIISFAGNSDSATSVTIYYNGLSKPNIHYQIGDGEWTKAPGVAMLPSLKDGYSYMYSVDTNGEELTACFNDGNTWENNNNSNFKFKPGVYCIDNGSVKETPNTLNATFVFLGDTRANQPYYIRLSEVSNGTGPYTFSVAYRANGGEFTILGEDLSWNSKYPSSSQKGIVLQSGGVYEYYYTVYDSVGNFYSGYSSFDITGFSIASVTTNIKSPATLGSTIHFDHIESSCASPGTGNVYGAYPVYTLNFTLEGSDEPSYTTEHNNSYYRAVWTPTEAGIYTIDISGVDYFGQEASLTMQYEIIDDSSNNNNGTDDDNGTNDDNSSDNNDGTDDDNNASDDSTITFKEDTAIIYYNGYSTPYIHYQVEGGSWTSVPGVAMETSSDFEEYTHKATIDLNGASKVFVCFNDGNNNWDNNNGNNYEFTEGVWGCSEQNIIDLLKNNESNGSTDDSLTATNTITIYYKGYSTPYIHYQVGNGNWTSVPGIAMSKSTKLNGYGYEYTIDLGASDKATICFNDGNNNWDNNNGNNYTVTAGTYTFSNGTFTSVQ